MDRDLWPHTEKRQSRGWTSRMFPIPQTFPLLHTRHKDFSCQPTGVAHLKGDALRLRKPPKKVGKEPAMATARA